MVIKKSRNKVRLARHLRIRKTIIGSSSTPRLNVFRSNTNIYAQIINDEQHTTLVSASSLDKELNLKKHLRTKELGYNHEIWICFPKENRIEIIEDLEKYYREI